MRPDLRDDELRVAIGVRLRELRLREQRTQRELASAVGITQATLSNYERGGRGLPLATAMRLAVALGTSLTILIQGLEDIPYLTPVRTEPAGASVYDHAGCYATC